MTSSSIAELTKVGQHQRCEYLDLQRHSSPQWKELQIKTWRNRRERDELMLDLQWELKDFFDLIRQADRDQLVQLISDFLTIGIGFWMGGAIIFGFQLLKFLLNQDTADRTLMRYVSYLINFAGLFAISSVSLGLFALYRNCQRLYVRPNTLMTNYESWENKRIFVKILEMFSSSQSYAFTLFRQYSYTQMRYLSLCGWTVPGLAILLSWY